MGATTVEGNAFAPYGRSYGIKAAATNARAHPAKLPYGGLNRIRFEGSVSTTTGGPARYPRFGVHFTMHGDRGPAKVVSPAHRVAFSKRAAKGFIRQLVRRHFTLFATVSNATSSN